MFHRFLLMLTVAMALGLSQSACAIVDGLQKQEEISKTFDLKSGGTVSVENTNGSISVEGWDQDKVDVLAVKSANGYDQRDAEENLKRLEVVFDFRGNELKIETRYPHTMHFGGSVRYTLRVPRKIRLELHSTNGSVEASDVQGEIRLHTTNGSVKAENVGGSVDGSTTNGRATANFTSLSGGDIRLHTTNGTVQLGLPEDANADVSAHTTNGSIRTDFPITTRGIVGKHALEGTIGKGGSRIELRTTNGSVTISRGSRGTV
jgi:DUF4097 and DUF4098 domain-containing protein YvlB